MATRELNLLRTLLNVVKDEGILVYLMSSCLILKSKTFEQGTQLQRSLGGQSLLAPLFCHLCWDVLWSLSWSGIFRLNSTAHIA